MASPYQKAKDYGYSEDEIHQFLSQNDDRYQKAIDYGYSPEEIGQHFSKEEQDEESLPANVNRQLARSSLRAVETVGGAPRAFGELLEELVPEKLLVKGAEKVGLGEGAKTLLDFKNKFSPYKWLPSSDQLRKNVSDVIFGESSKPKNEWEEKADEVVSDFTALALPTGTGPIKLMKPALVALGANAAKEGIGLIGGTDKQQTYGKIGSMVFLSLVDRKGAQGLAKDLYSKATQARPADAVVSSKNLTKSIGTLEKQLMKGDPSAGSKKKSLALTKDIRSKIKDGNIEVSELEQFKRDINEARSGLYDEFKTDKVGRKSAKRNLDSVSKSIDDTLKEYGKINPEWEAFYRPANEVHGAIASSYKTRNWLEKNIKKVGFGSLLAELGLYAAGGIPGAIGATAVGAAALGTGELMARIYKSPTLTKHYTNVLNAAMKEDAIALHNNLKKLNEAIEKD